MEEKNYQSFNSSNSFHVTVFFQYLKLSENERFSVFTGSRKRPMACKGLVVPWYSYSNN